MSSNINIRVQTQADKAVTSLRGLSKGFQNLSREGKKSTKSMVTMIDSIGGFSRLFKDAGSFGIYKFAESLATTSNLATEIRESVHMFNVSMGELAESTAATVGELSELSGMDRIKMLDTVGEYNLLARSMGMASGNAQVLSENANKLALDLSALTNREYSKVADDLRSGLIGQAKTMYKYGVDVTEASLKQEALNQGISKSVRHMSQGEKMALRYSVIMRQTALSHGDFAETAGSAANQARIFRDRMLTLSRTIGSATIPMLEVALPYLNAMAKALNEVGKQVARFFGYTGELEQAKNTFSDFGASDVGLSEMGDDAETAEDKVKSLQSQLMGFDEINLYRDPVMSSPLDEMDVDMSAKFNLEPYNNSLDTMGQKSDEIFGRIMDKFNGLKKSFDMIRAAAQPTTAALKKLWDEGLTDLANFTWENIKGFYNNFLKPVGAWSLGEEGLPRLVNIINDMLGRFDWEGVTESLQRLFKAMVPFAKFAITGLIDFVEHFLVPIWEWKFNEGLSRLADVLSNVLEVVDWDSINEGLVGLFKALADLQILKLEGIVWLFENVFGPLAEWSFEKLVPEVLKLLTQAAKTLHDALIVLKPTWEWFWLELLGEMGESFGDGLIEGIKRLTQALKDFSKWVQSNPDKFNERAKVIAEIAVSFAKVWAAGKLMSPLVGISNKLFGSMIQFKKLQALFKFLSDDVSDFGGVASGALKSIPSMGTLVDTGSLSAVEKPVVKALAGLKIVTEDGVKDVSTSKLKASDLVDPELFPNLNSLFGGLKGVFDKPKGMLDAFKSVLTGGFGDIKTLIGNIKLDGLFSTLLSGTKSTGGQLIEGAKLTGGKLISVITTPIGMIRGLFIGLFEFVEGVKEKGIFGSLASGAEGIAGKILSVFEGLSNGLKIPGVKIGLIAGGIALLAYLIYDNWEEVSTLLKNLWDNVLEPIFKTMSDVISFLWTDVLKPLWAALKPVLEELGGIFKDLLENNSEMFGEIVKTLGELVVTLVEKLGPVISEGVKLIGSLLGPAIETLVEILGGALGMLEGVFKVIRGLVNADYDMVTEGFGAIGRGFADVVKNILILLKDLALGIVKGFWSLLKTLGNGLKDWVKDSVKRISPSNWFKKDKSTFDLPSANMEYSIGASYDFAPIPKLAGGGLVDAGQMFIANEAGPEMVGRYGSKTGVVNNEQIVSAISEGVYKAVTSASREDSGGDSGEAVMNIDGRELARVILPHLNREGKRQGYKPILNY